MNEKLLYDTIYKTLIEEDEEFTSLSDQGIFYAPELYIALLLGKEIKKMENKIFNSNVTWIRETDLGNGGPTDFAFKIEDSIIAFELKLRQTVHAYRSDVEKLKKLDQNHTKYFIALADSWERDQDNDGRIKALEKDYPEIRRISNFKSFETKQDRYVGAITCTVCVWKVN